MRKLLQKLPFYLSTDTFNSIQTNFMLSSFKNYETRRKKFDLSIFSINRKNGQVLFCFFFLFKEFHSTFNNCFFKKNINFRICSFFMSTQARRRLMRDFKKLQEDNQTSSNYPFFFLFPTIPLRHNCCSFGGQHYDLAGSDFRSR